MMPKKKKENSLKLQFEISGEISKPGIESDNFDEDNEILVFLDKESDSISEEIKQGIRRQLGLLDDVQVRIHFENGSILATGLIIIQVLGAIVDAISFSDYVRHLLKRITERTIRKRLLQIRRGSYIVSIQIIPFILGSDRPSEPSKLQKSKDWSEIIKNFVQVLALIIAGVWTYQIFVKKEAPTLESIVNVSTSLEEVLTDDSSIYQANFQVDFKNTGISSVDISKIRIRGWKFKVIMGKDQNLSYINIDEIQNFGKIIFDKTYGTKGSLQELTAVSPFIWHYPPGSGYNHTFQWIINKDEIENWICFKIEFYREFTDSYPAWVSGNWNLIK